MKESEIQTKILRWLNSQPNIKAIKLHVGPYMRTGTPDLLAVKDGKAYFLEVKRPGEFPKPIQVVEMDEWKDVGAVTAVVHSVEEVKQVMEG